MNRVPRAMTTQDVQPLTTDGTASPIHEDKDEPPQSAPALTVRSHLRCVPSLPLPIPPAVAPAEAASPSDVKSGHAKPPLAVLDATDIIPAQTARRGAHTWPMTVVLVALLGLVGWNGFAVLSVMSYHPRRAATPKRDVAVTAAALPAGGPATATPKREVEVISAALPAEAPPSANAAFQPKGVSLANVRLVWGKIPRPRLVRAMRRSLAKMERCLGHKPQDAHGLPPTAALTIRLRRDGHVRWVGAGELAPEDDCIVRSIKETRFPRTESGAMAEAVLLFTDRSP